MNRRAHLLGVFKDTTGGRAGISPCSPDSSSLPSLYGYMPSTLARTPIMFPRAPAPSSRPRLQQEVDIEGFMKRHEHRERDRLRRL